MRDGTVSSYRRQILAPIATALVAFMAALLLLSDRPALHAPAVQAQIPRRSQPPPPTPAEPADQVVRRRADAGLDPNAPAPPKTCSRILTPTSGTTFGSITRPTRVSSTSPPRPRWPGFFGDDTSTGTGSGFVIDKARPYPDQFSRRARERRQRLVQVKLFDGSSHEARIDRCRCDQRRGRALRSACRRKSCFR